MPSSSLALVAVVLLLIGAGMTGAGVLLPYNNIKVPSVSDFSLSSLSLPTTYVVLQPANGQIQVMMSDGQLVGSPQNIADLHGATPEGYTGSSIGYAGTYHGIWGLSFVAVPNPGYNFTYWTINGSNVGTGNPVHSLMGTTAPVTIGAVFTLMPISNSTSNSTSSQHNQTTVLPADPYLKYLNILTLPGLVLLVMGACTLPISMMGKKGHK